MKTPDHLPIHMVLQLANAACEKYGFRKLSGLELRPMYDTKQAYPAVIRENVDGMLWVDKWYVAVQHDDGYVKYLYNTKHHILEEVCSYKQVKAELPKDILKEFRAAQQWMKATKQEIYFSGTAETLGPAWVRAWREKHKGEYEVCSRK